MIEYASLDSLFAALPDGAHVYLPGASGEPGGVMTALQNYWPQGKRLAITTTFLPGVNHIDFSRLDPAIEVTGLFMPKIYGDAARRRQYRHVPISYATFGRWIDREAHFDATIVQVALPDAEGRFSLGPSVEFTMQAIARSRQTVAVVNPNVPFLPNAPALSPEMISAFCESDAPVTAYAMAGDAMSEAVAAQVASLIEDDAWLQVGIGKIPNALLRLLRDRRNLRFWSGLVSDGIMDLVEGGAVHADGIGHSCMCLGTHDFYKWLRDRNDIVIHGCGQSHNPHLLTALEGFVAVNGAVEVDLFGQCNSERINGRALSGAGGAPDFAYAARRGAGGKSIIALPSEGGGRSRIVPPLGSGSMTTLTRTEVDFVVTEQGVADLRFASVPERGERLIAVAAPQYRAELSAAWNDILDRL